MKRKIPLRTDTCGDLTEAMVGKTVTITGWVHKSRNLGALVFMDVRDRFGITQVIFDERYTRKELCERAKEIRLEDVVAVTGVVALRENPNPLIKTGLIEIQVADFELLSKARVAPFPIADDMAVVNEELRLQYRYLDMRKGEIVPKLVFRHHAMQAVRKYLSAHDFIEVTTPILGKSTPEGARDYLVPSRVHPGHFYALPQSPQIFKQLLMVGGLDRYFQIATCFRDEDLRADRQPEFQQIDIEMSFATAEELFPIIEGLVADLFKETKGVTLSHPFRRMTYHDAMEQYGSDKPDLRFGMPLIDVSDIAEASQFSIFHEALRAGGIIRGICVKSGAVLSRKEIDEYTKLVSQFGFKGLGWIKVDEAGVDGRRFHGPIAKFISASDESLWSDRFLAESGDLILVVAGQKKRALQALDQLRRRIARDQGLIANDHFVPLWVTDFPLFQWDEEHDCIESEHHPFTSPHLLDIDFIDRDPLRVRSSSYDLVLNGYEVASGSQRIHDSELQEKIFSIIGLNEQERQERFGFFIEALQYGTPPHLGIALGFDRLIMILLGTENIRDVIAFPKNQRAFDLMSGAPSDVTIQQLKELHIEAKK